MKFAIRKIDEALKRLYNLHSPLCAEDFLLNCPPGQTPALRGALLIQEDPTGKDLHLGIYLDKSARQQLNGFRQWSAPWSSEQMAAFGVAAEEVSHFHYVAHHAPSGRGVSQLELELQGEIDRFLLTYYALAPREAGLTFQKLWNIFFEKFRWAEGLSSEAHERYEQAHRSAKEFLIKHAHLLQTPKQSETFLKLIREFYRLSLAEKITHAKR